MDLVQSKMPPDEIARQMTIRGSSGSDLSLVERLFGIVCWEEWKGREKEVAVVIVRNMREGLKGYPGILEHIDGALVEFAGAPGAPAVPLQARPLHHLVGELSGPGVINAPYCHF
jgi:hypothetical protein